MNTTEIETAAWFYYLDKTANRFGIRDERGEHIATIEGGGWRGKGTFENRARIITAAPDGMKLAKHILALETDPYLQGHPEWEAFLNEAQALINKTEGKS